MGRASGTTQERHRYALRIRGTLKSTTHHCFRRSQNGLADLSTCHVYRCIELRRLLGLTSSLAAERLILDRINCKAQLRSIEDREAQKHLKTRLISDSN